MDPALHDRVLAEALAAADAGGVAGQDVTPFVLARFHERTGGESLRANVRLVLRNAALAGRIAGAARDVSGGPVVVVGDVMTDVLAAFDGPLVPAGDTPASIALRPGGSGANTAAWLGHLGVPTIFVGRRGRRRLRARRRARPARGRGHAPAGDGRGGRDRHGHRAGGRGRRADDAARLGRERRAGRRAHSRGRPAARGASAPVRLHPPEALDPAGGARRPGGRPGGGGDDLARRGVGRAPGRRGRGVVPAASRGGSERPS